MTAVNTIMLPRLEPAPYRVYEHTDNGGRRYYTVWAGRQLVARIRNTPLAKAYAKISTHGTTSVDGDGKPRE